MRKIVVLIILFFWSCEQSPKYEEKENLRNLYVFVNLLPTEEKLKEICIDSEKQALNCSGLNQFSYFGIISKFYKITITSSSPEVYCDSLIRSEIFEEGKFSLDARRCHFDCNQKFWQSKENCSSSVTLEEYSKCLPGIWAVQCENVSFKRCLRNCFENGDPIWFIQ
ncbi:MAG: hypothetical protein NZ853_08405 [Leptospiraceae bacterium]|nr:hypothetical protein [Leptospiraceae bacterium]MDW7976804.1 hypothetical protein [Leptospiraceae bacterium]